MTDQEFIDRIEGLAVAQVCELAECLADYSLVMAGGESENPLEAKLLLRTMLAILAGRG